MGEGSRKQRLVKSRESEDEAPDHPELEPAHLEALLLEGLRAGEEVEATPEFWKQLRTEVIQILAERRKV